MCSGSAVADVVSPKHRRPARLLKKPKPKYVHMAVYTRSVAAGYRIHIYANKHLSEADSSDPSLVEPLESEEDILLEAFLRGAVTFSQQDPPALEDRRLRV